MLLIRNRVFYLEHHLRRKLIGVMTLCADKSITIQLFPRTATLLLPDAKPLEASSCAVWVRFPSVVCVEAGGLSSKAKSRCLAAMGCTAPHEQGRRCQFRYSAPAMDVCMSAVI